MPLTATMRPFLIAAAALSSAWQSSPCATSTAPEEPSSCRWGPHSGQALGWAWNRRSPGSPYSLRHAGQSVKPAMVVWSRSYGSARTIVKRGPQCVQLVKA